MSNLYNKKIQFDIANWISREPYTLLSDIEIKINNRLQKKYKLKIDSKILKGEIRSYKEIYNVAKKKLPKYILHLESRYAYPKSINNKGIKEFLTKKFPKEDKKILDNIINWVIYYEYLS